MCFQGGVATVAVNRQGGEFRTGTYGGKGAGLAAFPWQLFAAVAFAVIGIVIFSAALTMFTRGNVPRRGDGGNVASYERTVPVSSEAAVPQTSSEAQPVVHADFTGTWQKTDVYESERASLVIAAQDEAGFAFTLKLWNGKKTASVAGTAYYTGGEAAAFTQGLSSLTFERGSRYMTVYCSGSAAAFGLADGFRPDGRYTDGTPQYYARQQGGGYDYSVYQSKAVVKALSDTLSKSDYALYQEMMTKGLQSPIPYERRLDKNGKKVNVDTQLDCVKYYASLDASGMEMIFICSESGRIYVLFYDSAEMRYYSNDAAYASEMPDAFQAVARAKNLTPLMLTETR